MSQIKLAAAAIALELGAWVQLGAGASDDEALARYFLAHGAASVAAALFTLAFLPRRYREPRLPVAAILFSVSFFVPVLGFVGLLGAILALPLLPRLAAPLSFKALMLPELDLHEKVGASGFRSTAVREFLRNTRVPADSRMRALVALGNAPTRVASPMLRDLLADPVEDLRLLAYNMLDSREKAITAKIHERLASYAAATGEERAAAARRLAQLNWELIYQDLAQGDLRNHAANEALRYCEEALGHAPRDASMLLLRGRLHQALGRPEAARADYESAIESGMPDSRVVPFLAELAYDARDFERVRRLMAGLSNWRGLAKLEPVIRFWRGQA